MGKHFYKIFNKLIIISALINPLSTHASTQLLNNVQEIHNLSLHDIYYQEPNGTSKDEMIEALTSDNKKHLTHIDNLGYASGAYWSVNQIRNNSTDTDWVLHFSDPLVEKISIYVVGEKTASITENFLQRSTFNNILPTGISFRLKLESNHSYFILIRTEANVYDQTAGIKLIKASYFPDWSMKNMLIYTLILGGMLALSVYSLVLFLLVKDVSYGWYAAFSLSVFIITLNLYGYLYPLLGLEHINRKFDYTILCFVSLFSLIFVYHFLEIKKLSRRLAKATWSIAGIMVVIFIITFFIDAPSFAEAAGLTLLGTIIYSMSLSVLGYKKGRPGSGYLFFAWTPLLLILILAFWNIVFSQVGAVSYDIELLANFAIFLQLFIFLLAVVNKINVNQELKVLAENANFNKSRFLAAASHDLRQPLHAMGLFIGALKYSKDKHETEEFQSKLSSCQEALTQRFDSLLDISKLDAGIVEKNVRSIPVSTPFKRIIQLFDSQANDKGIQIRYRACDCTINTDPILFERILSNLISNAIRYTDSGSILFSARNNGDNCLIQVWDTGCGIHENDQESIFEEFKQLNHATHGDNTGLGIGLAIVKRLCLLLDIKISVSSKIGRGSVFSLIVPKHTGQSILEPRETYTDNINKLAGVNILIIDDDIGVRNAMADILTKWDVSVSAVESYDSALRIIESKSLTPDLILADYRLNEELNGIEIIEKLRKMFKHDIPSLLITGDTSDEIISEINKSNIPVLYKPVNHAKLRIMINGLIRH